MWIASTGVNALRSDRDPIMQGHMCPHSFSSVNVNASWATWRTAYSADIFWPVSLCPYVHFFMAIAKISTLTTTSWLILFLKGEIFLHAAAQHSFSASCLLSLMPTNSDNWWHLYTGSKLNMVLIKMNDTCLRQVRSDHKWSQETHLIRILMPGVNTYLALATCDWISQDGC